MSIIRKRIPAKPRSRHFDYYPSEIEGSGELSLSSPVSWTGSEDLDANGVVEQIDNETGANLVVEITNDSEDSHIKAYRGKLKVVVSGSGNAVIGLSQDDADPLKLIYTLGNVSFPVASASVLGGIKVGAGLSIDANGVLSATASGGYTLPVASASVLGGIKVGAGLSIDVNGVLSATASGGYTLPVASASVLGGIKVGAGLSIDANGVLSATASGGTSYFSLSGSTLSPLSKSYQLFTYGNLPYSTLGVRHVGNHVDGMNNGVVGNLYLNADLYDEPTPNVYVRINNKGGGVYTDSWSKVSDVRKKGNIEPLGDVLASVLSLDTFYYNPVRNGVPDTGVKNIGFSANQIREIYPELVSEDEEGFYSLDYSNITVLLVKALKELYERIEGMTKG